MENRTDLTDKMKELVIEEKANETNWNNLPFEMKEMVVKEMTLDTRARLKTCSKSDKRLVESTPMLYETLKVRVDKYGEGMIYTFLFENKSDAVVFFLMTVDLHSGITIHRVRPDGPTWKFPCSSLEEGENMVKKILTDFIFPKNLRFKTVHVCIDHPNVFENDEFTIHTKHIEIEALPNQVTGWLNKLAPGVESIRIVAEEFQFDGQVNGLGTIPAVINAQKLVISRDCDVTDAQLVNFKCTSIEIKEKSKITGKGINQLIKKAIANDYPVRSICIIYINDDDEVMDRYRRQVYEGLEVKREHINDDESDEYDEYDESYIVMGRDKRISFWFTNLNGFTMRVDQF